jgi:hypothetical protein
MLTFLCCCCSCQEYRQRRAAQERDKQASATADFYSLFDGGLSMGELPPGVDLDKLDTLLQQLGPELAQELGLRWVWSRGGCPLCALLCTLL